MAKLRVYQLAEELGLKSKELTAILSDLGVEVKSHMSGIEQSTADLVKELILEKKEVKKTPAKKPATKKDKEEGEEGSDKQEGEEFDIKEVLLLDDNGDTKIGTPYIKEASIKVKVLGEIKGDKVTVFKMKAKKRYERTQGHRQKYTEIEVLEIK